MKPQFPDIPPELVFEEILPRLPRKSLLEFRLVSKPWCATISDPKFARKLPIRIAALKNLDFDKNKSILYDVNCQSCTVEQRKLPRSLNSCYLRLLFAYNGLLLLEHGDDVFVFNPSTGKYSDSYNRNSKAGWANGIVDIGGICYDFSTRNYKVVVQIDPQSMTPGFDDLWMEFCSLGSKRCKPLKYPPGVVRFSSCGPVIDGKMYWLVRKSIPSEEIFFFDAIKNKFVGVPSPDPKNGSKHDIRSLFDLDGCLAMARLDETGSRFKDIVMEVLVMKRHGVKESWTPLFTFSNFNGQYPSFLEPLSITINGELLIRFFCKDGMYNNYGVKVLAYNREADTYRDIFVPEEGCQAAVLYREAFLCLPADTKYTASRKRKQDPADTKYTASRKRKQEQRKSWRHI